jgi:hypothetical protein
MANYYGANADDKQAKFLSELLSFINRVKAMPAFRGKTQAIRALTRIANMSAFN